MKRYKRQQIMKERLYTPIFEIRKNHISKEQRHLIPNAIQTDYYCIALESGEILVEKDTIMECIKETLKLEAKKPNYSVRMFKVIK